MLYRRGASIVDAIYLDGSERAWGAALMLSECRSNRVPAGLEIHAPSGKLTAHPGQWLTYHRPTGTARTFSPDRFHAKHEAC